MINRWRWLLAASAIVSTCTACGGAVVDTYAIDALEALPGTPSTSEPVPAESASTTTTISPRQEQCQEDELLTASYPPADPADIAEDSFMARLRELGRIRVGVDENTQGFSARDQRTGEIEGFEVAMAHEIARRVFGDEYTVEKVKLVPLVTLEKTAFVADEKVDLTISATSMSCRRWEQVDFSAEYYTASQEFLVRSDSRIDGVDDLADATVCVTAQSSSIGIMERLAPEAELHEVEARTDCLVALQTGEVDAYFGHDSFLYGMLEQDPTLVVRAGIFDPVDTVSHYGIAINRQHPEFTRFVNGVLEEVASDGTWSALAKDWLLPLGIPPEQLATPPAPDYRRQS